MKKAERNKLLLKDMHITQDYLIQQFAIAREKQATYTNTIHYWSGIMDTYHTLLVKFYPGWADKGTIGYYVFYEGLTYGGAEFYSRNELAVKETV